jgi:hypothetical protein
MERREKSKGKRNNGREGEGVAKESEKKKREWQS